MAAHPMMRFGLRPHGLCGVLGACLLAGCPSARPVVPAAAPVTTEVGGPLRGLAGDGGSLVATVGTRVTSRGAHVWNEELAPGRGGTSASAAPTASPSPGVLAMADGLVYVGASAKLRGDPAAIVVALDAASGAERWRLPIDATGWSLITSVAPIADGVVVGGSFQGTLRAVNTVVESAGQTDGFVARIGKDGSLAWLLRLGGAADRRRGPRRRERDRRGRRSRAGRRLHRQRGVHRGARSRGADRGVAGDRRGPRGDSGARERARRLRGRDRARRFVDVRWRDTARARRSDGRRCAGRAAAALG